MHICVEQDGVYQAEASILQSDVYDGQLIESNERVEEPQQEHEIPEDLQKQNSWDHTSARKTVWDVSKQAPEG